MELKFKEHEVTEFLGRQEEIAKALLHPNADPSAPAIVLGLMNLCVDWLTLRRRVQELRACCIRLNGLRNHHRMMEVRIGKGLHARIRELEADLNQALEKKERLSKVVAGMPCQGPAERDAGGWPVVGKRIKDCGKCERCKERAKREKAEDGVSG